MDSDDEVAEDVVVVDVEEVDFNFVGTVFGGVGGRVALVSVTGADVGLAFVVVVVAELELVVFFGGKDKCFVESVLLLLDDEDVVDDVFVRSGRSGGGLLSPSPLSLGIISFSQVIYFNSVYDFLTPQLFWELIVHDLILWNFDHEVFSTNSFFSPVRPNYLMRV